MFACLNDACVVLFIDVYWNVLYVFECVFVVESEVFGDVLFKVICVF